MRLILPDIRQQADHDCGLAAMRTVLRYYGWKDRETLAVGEWLSTPVDGTDPRVIEGVYRSLGMWVVSGNFDMDGMRHHLRLARPVICALNGHYVVVAGIERGKVFYQCPSDGACQATLDEFVVRWQDIGRMGESYSQFGICAWI